MIDNRHTILSGETKILVEVLDDLGSNGGFNSKSLQIEITKPIVVVLNASKPLTFAKVELFSSEITPSKFENEIVHI